MSDRVYIGIDGGGTRARALVVDAAGQELARRTGPAGIVRAEDPAAAAATLGELTRSVLLDAQRSSADAVLCCALAGAGRRAERDAVSDGLLAQRAAPHVIIVGDAEALIADAFRGAQGVLLVAGTGSIAWARGSHGEQVRVGGWGLLLGDEGSGYAIGRAALLAVARAADGRAPQTALNTHVLRELQLNDASELIGWAARASKALVASLTPLTLRLADEGDEVARAIREDAVRELVLLATTAARRADITRPSVALAGGLIEPGGGLRDHLIAALRATLPDSSISTGTVDGARGATLIARAAAV